MTTVRLHGPTSERGRWAALRSRDRAADGSFFYAVRTTGVFCRPSCGSRQPRRENVEFFDTSAAALAAGYRPCRRCRPIAAGVADPRAGLVRAACERLMAAEDMPSIAALADDLGIAPSTLRRAFNEVLGLPPREFAAGLRDQRLHDGLRRSRTVTEAVFDAGYGSLGRAYERAQHRLGMSPSRRLQGGRNLRIAHTVVETELGLLAIAATSRGVCSIRFGASRAALERELEREFPQAQLAGDDETLAEWARAVVDWIARPAASLELPLDLQGTAFQIRVWEALRQIPFGQTRSYGQIAAELGRPTAARAVARACASNPVALAVPCHRVVAGDGGLSGYRWGPRRKAELLGRERDAADGRADTSGRRR